VPTLLGKIQNTDDKTRGFELGAVDYITRPFRPAEVKAWVRAHLTHNEMREEIQQQAHQSMELFHQAQEILDKGCNGFIQKSFNLKDLSLKLREVLDSA
jgi:CheY-like chemotaxis protein